MQEATGESVELASVDRGYAGEEAAAEAEAHSIRLVRWSRALRGQAGLRAVATQMGGGAQSFARATRFRRLKRRTTSGYLPRWRGCTLSLSLASFFTEPSLHSGRVHNTL